MSSQTVNSGRFVYRDPEINLFMSQEREKIEGLKHQARQELDADLLKLSKLELTDDIKVSKVWIDFQARINAKLCSQWFAHVSDSAKFVDALTGPLLEIFQENVKKARGTH